MLRPHHWAKNLLVLLPMLLDHRWTDASALTRAGLALVAFCMVSSSVYVTNDLADVEADRRHPTKRDRPFASGAIPTSAGPPLALILLGLGFSVSILTLPWGFTQVLTLYLILTLLYSFWLKRRLLVDVLILVGLYGIRLLAGAEATDVLISEWLLAFSVFFFLSLAFVKRYSELIRLEQEGGSGFMDGRGYRVADLGIIETVGPTSGYIAVLVLALYVSGNELAGMYRNPTGLWLLCPLLLYWITRVWFLARRGDLHDDPIVFAFSDRVSLLSAFIALGLVVMALLGWGPRLG